MMASASPQSRYRQGTWTVTKLKEELRNRNLSPAGNKTELIDRLERADRTGSATPKDRRGRSLTRDDSPSSVRTKSLSPSSPSRKVNTMTVNQLKEELKQLGHSPVGKKSELMQRLQEAQASTNPFVEASKQAQLSSPSPRRRSRMSPAAASAGKNSLSTRHSGVSAISPDDIGLLTSPLTTLSLAIRCIFSLLGDALDHAARHPIFCINVTALSLLLVIINVMDLPNQPHLRAIQAATVWYSRWIILGILSSIGLGTGAHTFLLFLGPFIARVTTAAYVCMSLGFPLFGLESLLCPAGVYEKKDIAFWMVLNKIKWESFAWGLGTAIAALAGQSSGEIKLVEQIAAKPRKNRTWSESAQLASYGVVSRLGFLGILLCASIPNPLFDLAGITCGLFMIPFRTFAIATLLGKAVIKASIQSAFVVLLFSRDYLEHVVHFVQRTFPSWGEPFHQWILTQRTVFQERRPDPFMEKVGSAWHAILLVMMGYFLLSVIRSLAIMQARRDSILKKRA